MEYAYKKALLLWIALIVVIGSVILKAPALKPWQNWGLEYWHHISQILANWIAITLPPDVWRQFPHQNWPVALSQTFLGVGVAIALLGVLWLLWLACISIINPEREARQHRSRLKRHLPIVNAARPRLALSLFVTLIGASAALILIEPQSLPIKAYYGVVIDELRFLIFDHWPYGILRLSVTQVDWVVRLLIIAVELSLLWLLWRICVWITRRRKRRVPVTPTTAEKLRNPQQGPDATMKDGRWILK